MTDKYKDLREALEAFKRDGRVLGQNWDKVSGPHEIHALLAERDALLDRIDGLTTARFSYASLFPPIAEGENAGEPDVGGIHKNIRELIAERDALNTRFNVLLRVLRNHERAAGIQFRKSGNIYHEGRRVAYDQCCAEIQDALAQKQENQS